MVLVALLVASLFSGAAGALGAGMKLPGFIGGSYQSLAFSADCQQTFITSGKRGYIYDLIANSLTQIVGQPGFPAAVRMGAFVDGYFLALWDGSDRFSASNLENGSIWLGTNVGERNIRSDNFVAL